MYTLSEHLSAGGASMKATFLDLRKRSKAIVRALDQNQSVTLVYRGKTKGVIFPASGLPGKTVSVSRHPAFGMWRERTDLRDVRGFVERVRKRRHAL